MFFAGEASSVDFLSTVHGAFASGIREAKNVIAVDQGGAKNEGEEEKEEEAE